MNSKFFVSFELAKALKEKDYPQFEDSTVWCGLYYYTDTGEKLRGCDMLNIPAKENYCVAPTYAEVIDWLNDKNIDILIKYGKPFSKYKYEAVVYVSACEDKTNINWYDFYYKHPTLGNTKEEALEKAIQKSLMLL